VTFFCFKPSYFILRCTASDEGFFSVYVLLNILNLGYHPTRPITENGKTKHKSELPRMKESKQRIDFVLMFLHYTTHIVVTYQHISMDMAKQQGKQFLRKLCLH
jgi:hypothetical protein